MKLGPGKLLSYALWQLRRDKLTTCCSMSTKAILCPGQGTQYIGMFGDQWSKSNILREIVKTSKDILGEDVIGIGNDGPLSKLSLTKYCQPAVVLSSILTFEHLKEAGDLQHASIKAIAGYSVGELSSLNMAGCISFENVMKIVRVRADVMQHASNTHNTGMLTIQSIPKEKIQELCHELNSLQTDSKNHVNIAIEMYPMSTVIGGTVRMLDGIVERGHPLLKEPSIKLSRLPVSGAFHTPYMESAQEGLNDILHKIEINTAPLENPDFKVYSNVTGKPFKSTDNIRDLLVKQICEPVKWTNIIQDVNLMFKEKKLDSILELGPGNNLQSILGKINRRAIRVTQSLDLNS